MRNALREARTSCASRMTACGAASAARVDASASAAAAARGPPAEQAGGEKRKRSERAQCSFVAPSASMPYATSAASSRCARGRDACAAASPHDNSATCAAREQHRRRQHTLEDNRCMSTRAFYAPCLAARARRGGGGVGGHVFAQSRQHITAAAAAAASVSTSARCRCCVATACSTRQSVMMTRAKPPAYAVTRPGGAAAAKRQRRV